MASPKKRKRQAVFAKAAPEEPQSIGLFPKKAKPQKHALRDQEY
jgi:hypothetical protein